MRPTRFEVALAWVGWQLTMDPLLAYLRHARYLRLKRMRDEML